MLRCMICCLFVVHFQYAFTVKEESDVMIALMQEDTRKEKERGVENLTIGYFVMKVTILGLQPRDKAAMLGVKTKEYFLEEFT